MNLNTSVEEDYSVISTDHAAFVGANTHRAQEPLRGKFVTKEMLKKSTVHRSIRANGIFSDSQATQVSGLWFARVACWHEMDYFCRLDPIQAGSN